MTMPDTCPDCGHSLAVHFTDDDDVFRCGVCGCSDEEDED